MKINAISNQNYSANLNANVKNNKVSAQSSKAQQYFSDSVSFSGALPKVSKLRAGIIGLAATLLAAGGFTAGTVTANASTPKRVEKRISEEYTETASPVSEDEKQEIKEKITKIENKIINNENKIDRIKDTQNKLEFLKYAKTKSERSYISTVSGAETINPYANYFEYVYINSGTHYFDYDVATKMEDEADNYTLKLLEKTENELEKLQGDAESPKERIKQLKAENKKLTNKVDKLYNKIMEPRQNIERIKITYPIPTEAIYRPNNYDGVEPWEEPAGLPEGASTNPEDFPTSTGLPELSEPCHCGDYEH